MEHRADPKAVMEKAGRIAFVHYRGGAVGEDGELDEKLVDDRSSGDALPIRLGMNAVPPGFEAALYEMEVGEEREITIESSEAYGVYNPQEVQWYTRIMIPNGDNLHVGDVLVYTRPSDGLKLPARVIEETEDGLKIDLNHPFAGRQLKYWIKLEDLR